MSEFSVLMSVYAGENSLFLKQSLQSLLNQSLSPTEVVLVRDGELTPELEKVIRKFGAVYENLFIISLDHNNGLGKSLQVGLEHTSYEIIARMDSDDIAANDRFEKQIGFLEKHKNIDVVGGNIMEFVVDYRAPLSVRRVPESHEEILKHSKWKNPMNHMSVVFRKSAVLTSGNYQSFFGFEDYHLWVRMLKNGKVFHNLQENLIFARVGNNMIGRRHGFDYLKNEIKFINWMYNINFINVFETFSMIVIRSIARLLPKKVLQFLYIKLNRE